MDIKMDLRTRVPQLFKRDSSVPSSRISERLDRYIVQVPKEIPLSPRPVTRAPRPRPEPMWLD